MSSKGSGSMEMREGTSSLLPAMPEHEISLSGADPPGLDRFASGSPRSLGSFRQGRRSLNSDPTAFGDNLRRTTNLSEGGQMRQGVRTRDNTTGIDIFDHPRLIRANSIVLGNMKSIGDIHVSLPNGSQTMTAAAVAALQPSEWRPSTFTLSTMASQPLSLLSDGLPDGGKLQRLQEEEQVEQALFRGTTRLSRASTESNEAAVSKLVQELKEETAKMGREQGRTGPVNSNRWAWLAILIWIGLFTTAAVLLEQRGHNVEFLHLYLWRWCIAVACLPVVWFLPKKIIFLVIVIMETQLWGSGNSKSQLVYQLMGIRHSAVALMRMVGAFIVIHFVIVGGMDPQHLQWEGNINKFWLCGSLLCFANVLKSLAARSVGRHFHTKSYFERMRDAVQKEYFLMALTKPKTPIRYAVDVSTVFKGAGLSRLTAGVANLLHLKKQKPAGLVTRSKSFDFSGGTGASAGGGGGADSSVQAGSIKGDGGAANLSLSRRESEAPTIKEGSRRLKQQFPDEAAPLLGSTAVSSSKATAAGSPFLRASGACHASDGAGTGAAASTSSAPFPRPAPLGRKASDASSSAPSMARLASLMPGAEQAQQVKSFIAEAIESFRQSWKRVSLIHRQHKKGDVVTVIGPKGMTPMLPSEAMTMSMAKVDPSPRQTPDPTIHGSNRAQARLLATDAYPSLNGNARSASISSMGKRPSLLGLQRSDSQARREAAASAAAVTMERQRASRARKDLHASKQTKTREDMQMSLYWLEQHIRHNKLRYTTLTDQIGAAADLPDSSNEVNTQGEARKLAFYLYWNVLEHNLVRPYVVPRDLEAFFDTPEEVKACFKILDTDEDGKATLGNIVDACTAIYKERKKLAITLKDTKSVVAKLELVCGVVIHMGFALLYLYIFNVNITSIWVSISTIILAFAFVFGNSVKSMYESVLFLFVVHAFDVGDWLALSSGDLVKVEEIALLSITALRTDGRRMYIPTPKLMSDITINMSRSDNWWDTVSILVDITTPSSALEEVELVLKRFVAQHPREYTGEVGVVARGMDNPVKFKLLVFWEYNHVAEDTLRTLEWRSKIIMTACAALRDAGVDLYTSPPEAPFMLPPGTKFWDPTDPQSVPPAEATNADSKVYLHTRTGAVFARGYAPNSPGGSGFVSRAGSKYRGKV